MTREPWTSAQLDGLARLYPDFTADLVAKVIGRSAGSVHRKAAQLGLTKSEAFLASDRSGRIQRGKQHPSMVASQFQAGQTPWNKGTHYVAGGRSAETRFKPGRLPHEARNYAPIGSYRVNADGHLERKVTDDPSLVPARRWAPVYRLVYEAAHGLIPKDRIVVFKPGQKTKVLEEITLDRLECISRAENARRNHPRNKHPEYARLVQLKGAITRQVNRITEEAREAQQP